MAIKPSATYTWATDALFTSGPATGFATKLVPASLPQGFVPGDGINAEWVNYLLNIDGQWITDWLDLGSFAGAEDAHILETNADGQTTIARAIIGPHSVNSTGLVVNPGGTTGDGIVVTQASAGGVAIDATGSLSSEVIFARNSGAGEGADISNTGTGLVALRALLSSASGSAGAAVFGQVVSGGDDTAAVHGFALSGNYYGVKAEADPTSPGRAALWVVPQDTAPTGNEQGAIYYDSTEQQLGVNRGSSWGYAWVSFSGLTEDYVESLGVSTEGAGTWTTKTSRNFTTRRDLADIWIIATVECHSSAGGPGLPNVDGEIRLRDTTNGATIKGPLDVYMHFRDGAVNGTRMMQIQALYSVPTAGTTNLALQFRTTRGGAGDFHVKNAQMHMLGDFAVQS